MSKPRICIDMDEVMADIYAKFEDIFFAKHGYRPDLQDYQGKKFYTLPGMEQLRQMLYEPGFFRDLPVMDHAVEVVQELQLDYDVWITTAATEFRNCLTDKFDWLEEHFPFIHWSRYVFCGDKSIFNGAYMIDDKVENLKPFPGQGLLYTASHNIGEEGFLRVNNWMEIRDFFRAETAKRKHG